jgi:hypothetical protein
MSLQDPTAQKGHHLHAQREEGQAQRQHIHMLVFGSITPAFVSLAASVPSVQAMILAALDTQVSARPVVVNVCPRHDR